MKSQETCSVAVRIVNVDFYMASPIPDLDVLYSDFRGSSIGQVPIIRIFGSTDDGKKICLHVHGVFPYFYIPFDGSEDANSLQYQIAASIDKGINVSFGQASSLAHHIYKVSLVSGIPFYGYHAREHLFFKVLLFNPALVRKVANMLQSEAILGKLYQPHESHIPYILQFMVDYNLHGMSKILLKSLKFRTDSDSNKIAADPILKQSVCELEADALCEHILNRLEVTNNKFGINPGIAALWEDEKHRLRNKHLDSQIGPCLTLGNSQVAPTKSHLIFKNALMEKLSLTEKVAEKIGSNMTVYPAETPQNKSVINASFLDFNSSLSSESANDSMDLNNTLVLVDEAKDLYAVLQELGGNVENEEADSVLSQVEKDEDEDNEDYLDLSISMAEMTPFKNMENVNNDSNESSMLGDSFNKTLIPQLDGQQDSNSSDESNVISNGPHTQQDVIEKYAPLPICVSASAKKELQNTPISNQNVCDKYDRVKRKLSFVRPDVTICEDSVECQYRSARKQHTICSLESAPNAEPIYRRDIFEEKKEVRTVAELYDIQTNFKAKESSSTRLTQNSESGDLKLSSESSSDLWNSQKQDINATNINHPVIMSELEASNEIDRGNVQSQFQTLNEPPIMYQNSISLECKPSQESSSFEKLSGDYVLLIPQAKPPTKTDVINSMTQLNISHVCHEVPYYGDVSDVTGSVEIGHSVLKVYSKTTAHLEDFKARFNGLDAHRKKLMPAVEKWSHESVKNFKLSLCSLETCLITPVRRPPTLKAVEKWIVNKSETSTTRVEKRDIEKRKIYIPGSPGKQDESDMEMSLTISISPCDDENAQSIQSDCASPTVETTSKKRKHQITGGEISGVTLNNTYGFKMTPENYQNARVVHDFQHLTVMSMELHIRTRGDLKPDPKYDSIMAVFYSIFEDRPEPVNKSGVIAIGSTIKQSDVDCDLLCVDSEVEVLNELTKLVHRFNPDILVGYEIEMLSWGYLFDRSQVLEINLYASLSRIKNKPNRNYGDEKGLCITGRLILDVWRLLRHEVALQSYTFENITYHLIHKRIPLCSMKDLTSWWDDPSSLYIHRTVSCYLFRVRGVLQILEHLDFIGRTSELARLFGIQFFEVLSRGTQFRVESMMLRLAKPLNFIPVSPSVQQRAKMKAPEFLPLILEPESKLYVDPVIVLDFQSLYPSMIIAYNYCFSTCIGKVMNLGRNTPYEFGATQLKVSRARLKKLLHKDALNFSPCGVAFVKSHIRDGILPRMLREILDTRLMVKNSMKANKDDPVLQKVLHNRQLGLKLIANVTYGYTAANFSGRMAAVELADSVVSKGRETLQKAIAMVENTPEWKAKVVYGDTDSLFVLVPGTTKAEAFEVGKKIAEAVTKDNPDPVKLKLEKVYQPCILQTKKRYVGYMYESPADSEPIYDAKGIETVRRDGCPAVSKMLEKCLRLLFETKNVSLVKQYVLRQFDKILTNRVSLQALTFAKEYRGSSGYRPGACVPALELARKWMQVDCRNEPRRNERVPYVIASGPPGLPLIRLVRSPREFLSDPSLRPNAFYYITKVIIPPINRCFNLIGVNLMTWFNQMPRKQFHYLPIVSPSKKTTISQYFLTTSCAACGNQTQNNLCNECVKQPVKTCVTLNEKMHYWECTHSDISLICESCTGFSDKDVCISLDCPILYKVSQTSRDVQQATYVRNVLSLLSTQE